MAKSGLKPGFIHGQNHCMWLLFTSLTEWWKQGNLRILLKSTLFTTGIMRPDASLKDISFISVYIHIKYTHHLYVYVFIRFNH